MQLIRAILVFALINISKENEYMIFENWNGEMDYGWDGLSDLIKQTVNKFVDIVLQYPQCAPSDKVGELLTVKSMARFTEIAELFAEGIKDGFYYQYQDLFEDVQNGRLINSWILLGSLIEVSLQVFLTIYISDYEDMEWQQWKNFNQEAVKDSLFEVLNDMVQKKNLSSKHSRSIKKAIESKILEHTVEHPVEKVMLDELIQICEQEKLFNDDVNGCLRLIQKSRNAIHAYMDRTIGNWDDLQYATRFFATFLDEMLMRLPDLPDEDYYQW